MRVTINLASRQFADFAPVIKNLRTAMAVLAGVAVLLLVGLPFVHGKHGSASTRWILKSLSCGRNSKAIRPPCASPTMRAPCSNRKT